MPLSLRVDAHVLAVCLLTFLQLGSAVHFHGQPKDLALVANRSIVRSKSTAAVDEGSSEEWGDWDGTGEYEGEQDEAESTKPEWLGTGQCNEHDMEIVQNLTTVEEESKLVQECINFSMGWTQDNTTFIWYPWLDHEKWNECLSDVYDLHHGCSTCWATLIDEMITRHCYCTPPFYSICDNACVNCLGDSTYELEACMGIKNAYHMWCPNATLFVHEEKRRAAFNKRRERRSLPAGPASKRRLPWSLPARPASKVSN
jgi:hypothetical protein